MVRETAGEVNVGRSRGRPDLALARDGSSTPAPLQDDFKVAGHSPQWRATGSAHGATWPRPGRGRTSSAGPHTVARRARVNLVSGPDAYGFLLRNRHTHRNRSLFPQVKSTRRGLVHNEFAAVIDAFLYRTPFRTAWRALYKPVLPRLLAEDWSGAVSEFLNKKKCHYHKRRVLAGIP